MSWTFHLGNWRFESDWEGLIVTPLSDDEIRRRKEIERERALAFELNQTTPPSESEKEVWA